MASTTHLPFVLPARHQLTHNLGFSVPTRTGGSRSRKPPRGVIGFAAGKDPLGEFGARDPFPAEVESQFGEKVLGNGNTEHKILIPNASAMSLAQLECSPVSPLQAPFEKDDTVQLLRKVVGWRLLDQEGGLKLQCLWKVRGFTAGIELIYRIHKVVGASGHYPDLHLEQPNQVRAELWTASIGGLSMNDFIIAAKIDGIKTSDLAPRKRVWA